MKKTIKHQLFVMSLSVLLFLLGASPAMSAVWYVNGKITVPGDGTSWDKAFDTIQAAIDAADETSPDEIWVKEGTYLLSSQIEIDKAVSIYGGFVGNELVRESRDWRHHETVVDGQYAVRCLEVVASDIENLVIDGLSITRGYSGLDANGGGLLLKRIEPPRSATIAHCKFLDNIASKWGGAIFYSVGEYTITDCCFADNNASMGGAIFNQLVRSTIVQCKFYENTATFGGGAIANIQSGGLIKDCTFEYNSAERGGGAIWNDFSRGTIDSNTFIGNEAALGGAISSEPGARATIINSIFLANFASEGGGAICNGHGSFDTITNSTFYGNKAELGGSIYNLASANPVITNCILWEGISMDGQEISDQYHENLPANPTVIYSDVQGGYPGIGNIDAPPLFSDPWGEDFHLTALSPCIDAGDITAPGLSAVDYEGDPRVGGAAPDMGADEFVD
jgi:hypothetical protein